MVNIGIIGCGYWGPNLIRNFNSLEDSKVYFCCDVDQNRLNEIKKKYPDVKTTLSYKEILKDPKVDGVVIAVPASRHFQLTLDSIYAGKDVLVEKPLAISEKDCLKLVNAADKHKKILMVGSTYIYNPFIRKIKEMIDKGDLGKIYSVTASREAPGPVRKDVNAFWDLATHDIAILLYLLGKKPTSISCVGQSYLQDCVEDVVYSTLIFPENIIVNIRSCWFNPFKERKMVVIGDKASVVFDEMCDKKLEVFIRDDSNFVLTKETIVPKVPAEEPLKIEVQHFSDCIKSRKKPLTDGQNGADIVKILVAGQKSLESGGTSVDIKW
jgi:predicted dehydrogenase